jgi:hypothetical protein
VPVTAKLSRRFYETFGDEIANELVEWFNAVDATYRADLRQLNEINFARFDAKVEQRFAAFELKMEQRFAAFEAKVEQRLAAFEQRLIGTESKLAGLETKLEGTKAELVTRGLRQSRARGVGPHPPSVPPCHFPGVWPGSWRSRRGHRLLRRLGPGPFGPAPG